MQISNVQLNIQVAAMLAIRFASFSFEYAWFLTVPRESKCVMLFSRPNRVRFMSDHIKVLIFKMKRQNFIINFIPTKYLVSADNFIDYLLPLWRPDNNSTDYIQASEKFRSSSE